MSGYKHLLGRPYIPGKQDCFSLARDYYRDLWDIHLPNFARPERFWEDPHLDLYARYQRFGFAPVFDKPVEVGDALLMPFFTTTNTHAAMVVEPNLILHHLNNQLSRVDSLRPKWLDRATIILRHPKVTSTNQLVQERARIDEVSNARIFRNPALQAKIGELLESE